jgi:hypothetical protein
LDAQRGNVKRALSAIAAGGCGALGLGLACHYPISPAWVSAAFVAFAAIFYTSKDSWLLVVPALLPAIGLASWTGWLTFEEFDMLVLAAAAAGYARNALRPLTGGSAAGTTADAREARRRSRISAVATLLIALFAISSIAALVRGLYSASPSPLGWWHGYHDPLNSLRIFKSYGLVLLMAPLLAGAIKRDPEEFSDKAALGLAMGLALAALAVVWERAAFPGLLDFSADYRATGFFWEMHVGGAALDGFIALTLPLAVWHVQRAPNLLRFSLSALVLTLGAYACVLTFSRGLYAAVLVSLALGLVLQLRQGDIGSRPSMARLFFHIASFAAVAGALSYLAFRSGGYRSLAALFGVFVVSLLQARLTRRMTWSQSILALVAGVVLAGLGFWAAALVQKGVYIVFAIAFCCAVGLSLGSSDASGKRVLALACYVWTAIAAALVTLNWGGRIAFVDSACALLVVSGLALWNAVSPKPLWPERPRTIALTMGGAALLAAIVTAFSAGAYIGGRFASSEHDLQGRIQHWADGLRLLDGADWLVGKGLGRFPASYFYGVADSAFPGSYRIVDDGRGPFMSLGGPRHVLGSGELFRIAQRMSVAPAGTYTLTLDARADQTTGLYVEICEKHLLYIGGCAIKMVEVKASKAAWQRLVVPLDGSVFTGGPWYAPRLAFFSMAVQSKGHLVAIDNVQVTGPDGTSRISNGDFSGGMAHWFFTSDKHHLPWHIKNLYLDVLFDQGIIGLGAFVLLVAGALVRLTVGRARAHPLAPFIAASIAGFLVVGFFDSLVDVPRVAFLFYMMVFIGLLLRAPAAGSSTSSTSAHDRAGSRSLTAVGGAVTRSTGERT